MPLVFSCPCCGLDGQFSDEQRGSSIVCPRCHSAVTLPGPAPPRPTAPAQAPVQPPVPAPVPVPQPRPNRPPPVSAAPTLSLPSGPVLDAGDRFAVWIGGPGGPPPPPPGAG